MNTLIDGFRSTLFEYDMQLFFVQFVVNGAVISDVEMYFARVDVMEDSTFDTNNTYEIKIKRTKVPKYKLNRVYDSGVEAAFREKYTPKAIIRRIQK